MKTDYEILIPSRGRWDRMKTTAYFSDEMRERTKIIVRSDEIDRYSESLKGPEGWIVRRPDWCPHIGAVRAWAIMECKARWCIMLDDDLVFRRRDKSGDWHSRIVRDPKEIQDGFEYLLDYASKNNLAQAGFGHYEGSNFYLDDWEPNYRITRAYALDTKQLGGVELGRIAMMEDFDLCLQLLRKGRPNACCFLWPQAGDPSNAKGGCSSYGDRLAQHSLCAKQLEGYHPGLVKTVEKQTKTAWGGQPRTDVIVSWKKAFDWDKKNANAKQMELL